jgi:hypothetical protein
MKLTNALVNVSPKNIKIKWENAKKRALLTFIANDV